MLAGFVPSAPALLKSNSPVTDGQRWESMETRASRSGTGSSTVSYKGACEGVGVGWRAAGFRVVMPGETAADP